MGNHSIIAPKSWQLTDNKEDESVKSDDCLWPGGTWHLTKNENINEIKYK